MTNQSWTRLRLSVAAILTVLAFGQRGVAVIADNNLPNCPPCEQWDGSQCVPKTMVAYASEEVSGGQTQYRVTVETTPIGLPVTYSILPAPDGSAPGGSVDGGGLVTPDGTASKVTVLVTLLGSDGTTVCATLPVEIPVAGCDSCGACSPGDDQASLDSGQVQYTMKTGGAGFEKAPALRIKMGAIAASAGQPTPRNLSILRTPDTEVIPDPATRGVRQALTAQALADVVVLSSTSYEVSFYKASDKGAKDGAGLYVPTASPFLKHTVSYIGGASPVLRVTKTIGSTTRVVEFEQNAATLKMRRGGMGDPVAWTDQTERSSVSLGGGVTNVTVTMKNSQGVVTSKLMETNQAFGWGPGLVGRVEDPDGTCPLRTVYSYYTTLGGDGYGRVKAVTRSDGSWVAYKYDSTGRETLRVEAWKDVAFDAQAAIETLAASAKATYSSYTSVDPGDSGGLSPRSPRTVEVKVAGVTVAKTYYAHKFSSEGDRAEIVERCATATAAYGAAGNLRTERGYDPAHPDRLKKVIQPDGVQDTIEYEPGSYVANGSQPGTFTYGSGDHLRRSVVHGTTTAPEGVAGKSTKEVSVINTWGGVPLTETHVKTDSGYERIGWQVHDLDEQGHEWHSYAHNGEQTDVNWEDCCGASSRTDATGIVTSYPTYDGLKRPLVVLKSGVAASPPYAAQSDITTTYEYNAAGQVTRETISAGGLSLVRTNGFDPAGRPTRSRATDGLETTYAYANGGRTTTVTRPGGATEITDHYLDGRVKSVTGTGVVARYYDYGASADGTAWAKVSTGSAGSALWETTTTDFLGQADKVEKPKFGGGTEVTQNEYAGGRLERTTRTGLADVCREYDDLGSLVRQGLDLDGNGNGLVLASKDRITDTDATFVKEGNDWWRVTVQKVYATDNSATPTTVTTSRDRLTGFAAGVVRESTSADIHGNVTTRTTAVDRAAKVVTQTTDTPDSAVNAESVSRNGLAQSARSTTGHTATYAHDALGRQTGGTDPRTGPSETHYNSLGQVDWVKDAANNQTSYTYNPDTGQRVAVTNAQNQVTRYDYTTRGELFRVWGHNTYPVEYSYDDWGRMKTMKTFRTDSGIDWFATAWPASPPTPDTTTWNYEEATGLLTEKVYADANKTTYTYEAQDRLLTRTWARTVDSAALVTTYGYDQSTGELLTVDYSDSTPDVTYTYNRLGQQKTVADAVGTRTFAYNAALQPDTETISGSLYNKVITRQYQATGTGLVSGRNAGFTLGTTADPDADQAITYGFDSLGRLAGVTALEAQGTRILGAGYEYLANAELVEHIRYSNSTDRVMTTTRAFDALNRLASVASLNVNSMVLSSNAYAYNAVSQRTAMTNQAGNRWEFGYDLRGQVSKGWQFTNQTELLSGRDFGYRFDPIGNRQSTTNSGLTTNYTANWLNQYTAVGPASPTHDADGNLTADGEWTYQWDGENRLVAAEKTGMRLTFTYDYLGRRVEKTVSVWDPEDEESSPIITSTFFVYDGWNLIAVLGSDLGLLTSFTWGLDLSGTLQGAGGVGGLLAVWDSSTLNSQPSTHFPCFDANGNVMALVNAADGNLAAQYEYGPFGERLYAAGTMADANPFQFSTKFRDAETGLYYYGYRYYTPGIGRWLNRDPIGERGGPNLYASCRNDMHSRVDPLGLAFVHDVTLGGRFYNQRLPLGVLGTTKGRDWTMRMQTRPCRCGVVMTEFRNHAIIEEYFALSETESRMPIAGQSTLQHEDTHAISLKNYYQTITDGAGIIYGRCVSEECFSAWQSYWVLLQQYAAARLRLEADQTDFDDPARGDGQWVTAAQLEKDKGDLRTAQAALVAAAGGMKRACGN